MNRGAFEPTTGPLLIKPVRAYASERIRIRWTLPDGSTFVDDDYTCPPMSVIDAKRKAALVELARREGQGQTHEDRH